MIKLVPNERVLLLKTRKAKILVVPDLHLGFEKELAEKGIAIPSQTEKIFSRIRKLIDALRPDRLIFLGDIKHGTVLIQPNEWREIPKFFERLLKLVERIDVIPGNHDGDIDKLLPDKVELATVRGLTVEDGRKRVSLIHGHAWPGPETFAADGLIMGHYHFTIRLTDSTGLRSFEPVWVMAKWNRAKAAAAYLKTMGIRAKDPLRSFRTNFGVGVKSPTIIVMPAFNQMLGGIAINEEHAHSKYLRPVFSSGLIDMKNSELYMLDGTYLGRLSQLGGTMSLKQEAG